MAVDKGKVKAALDTKFKGKSVSKELKEALAARWADKIDDEAGIDDYISEREDDILDAAKEADRRATAAAAKARQDAADAAAGKKTGTESPKTDDITESTPDYMKPVLEMMKSFKAELDGIKASKQAESIAERFRKDERLKGIPEAFFKGRVPSSEDDFEAAVTETLTDLKPVLEQMKLAGFGGDTPPGGKTGGNPTTKVDPDIVAFGKAKAAAVTSNN